MHVSSPRPGQFLVLDGRLDLRTLADVRTALHSAIDAGTGDLVVDLRDVEVRDATGLGVLVAAHRRADRAGRRLVLRHVPARMRRLLFVSRLHRVLHIETEATAASVR